MKKNEPIKDAKGRTICGAKTRAGTPCHRFPVAGRTRCRLHGGAQPVGLASAAMKDGRHSKYLPVNLRAAYEESRNDPALLELNDEIALVDARLREMLGRIGTAANAEAWTAMQREWKGFLRSQARGDVPGMQNGIASVSRIIESAANESTAWLEIGDLIERRRRLAQTEQRRHAVLKTMVTAESLDVLIAHLTRAVRDNVRDPVALRNISQAIGAVVGGNLAG